MFNTPLRYRLISLLPKHCLLCGERLAAQRQIVICQFCYNALPWLGHSCQLCSLPLTTTTAHAERCGQCLQQPPPFDASYCLFTYRHPVDKLISRLKFAQHLPTGHLLAKLLSEHLRKHLPASQLPDLLMPMPLHHTRLRRRGFNQAYELARDCAAEFDIPIAHNGCRRIKNTPSQLTLDATARRRNLKDAFRVDMNLDGLAVAIIDDVITTGSSMAELSRTLRNAGAAHIYLWSVARTPTAD